MLNKIQVGVIPAAGDSNRMGYLSRLLPKTLLPLYNRPIIHYVVKQMENLGIRQIYIVVHFQKEKIISYFHSLKNEFKAEINFIFQAQINGTANAILMSKKYVRNNNFMVIYGDDFTYANNLKKMPSLFFKNKAIALQAAVKETNKKILRQTCCLKIDKNKRILEILEKPKKPPYLLRGCGVYIFSPEIFSYINRTPAQNFTLEKEISHTIKAVSKKNQAFTFLLRGKNININFPADLLRASWIYKKMENKTSF